MNTNATPKEVRKEIADNLKRRGIKYEEAAKLLGYSKQTLANLISSADKYLSPKQAAKFSTALGYNDQYLTSGKGGLIDEAEEYRRNNELQYSLVAPDIKNDLSLAMSWIRIFLKRQNNKPGLELLEQINKYIKAEDTVKEKMQYYSGEFYREDFEDELFRYRKDIVEEINKTLREITE